MTDVLRIAQPTVAAVDPHVTTDRRATLAVRQAQFEALVRRDDRGAFRPALASNWTVSQDARRWTLRVRGGVRFHDGPPMTAEAVARSLARVRDWEAEGELGTTGVIQGYLQGAEIEPVADDVVQVDLVFPLADLLDLLVDLPIVSDGLEGTGRYRPETQGSDGVTMVAVDDYWGGGDGPARIVWRAIEDAGSRMDALRAGEVDLVADVPRSPLESSPGGSGFEVREQASPTCVAFLCNCFAGPCTDRRVRAALNVALDVPALIAGGADGDGEPLDGPLTPLHFAHDPAADPYRYDPDEARRLLRDAGIDGGITLTVDVPLTLPDEAPALARGMAAQWAEVGIHADIREHRDREAYALMVRSKGIGDAACFDSSPLSSYRVLREKLHSGVAGPWWQGYANANVDALLDQSAGTPDDGERQRLYRRAYRLIRDDAPWVFLYRPINRWAGRQEVRHAWGISVTGVIEVGG